MGNFYIIVCVHLALNCVFFIRTDGMDQEDSYPDQSCLTVNRRRKTVAGSHWEDLCSSASVCSQSSDEEIKLVQHKEELFAHGPDTRDYQASRVSIRPPCGPSALMGQAVDLGGSPYSGTNNALNLHTSLTLQP